MDPRVRLAATRWSSRSTRSRARSATRCARTSPASMRNRRLTELVRDVDARRRPRRARRAQQWDRDEVHTLFDDLQFRVLRERLFATVAAAEPEAEEGFDVAVTPARRRRRRRSGSTSTRATAAGSASPSAARGAAAPATLTGIALAAADGAAAYLDPSALSPDDDAALAGWLADPAVPKAVHDVKGRCSRCASTAGRSPGVTSDTQLAAYLLRPDQRTFDLADLALRYLHRELRSNVEESGPAHPRRRPGRIGRRARRGRDRPRHRGQAISPTPSTPSSSSGGATRLLAEHGAAADLRARRHGGRRHRRRHRRAARAAGRARRRR